MMSKLCPYDKLACNPGCVLYQAKDSLTDTDVDGKTTAKAHPAFCRKFGVI